MWDIEQFFDRIDSQLLIQRAVSLKFPLRDLLMALRMHLAPRCLQMCGMLAEAIYPTTSILAGCGFSIPFTRILLRGDVEEVVTAHAEVDRSVFVDDIGQSSIGFPRALFRQLLDAAICLGVMATRLKLRISSKTIIVTSSRAVSCQLQRSLRMQGIQCQVASASRDLGVLFHASGRRQGGLIKTRLGVT